MKLLIEVVEIPTDDSGFVGTASSGEEWVVPYPVAGMSVFSILCCFSRSAVRSLGSETPSARTSGSAGKSLESGTRFSRAFDPVDANLLTSRSLVLPRDCRVIPRLPGDLSLNRTADRRLL